MPPEPPGQPSPHRSEEDWPDKIDLHRHLLVPLSWWREIVLAGVLLTTVSPAIITLMSQHTAVATVIIIPETSKLRGLPAFTSRQAAMVGLVYHGQVAAAVLRRLGGQLREEERSVSWLMSTVSAELAEAQNRNNLSDMVRIKVTADSPEKARTIAGLWAEEYVREANLLQYAPEQQRRAIKEELSETLDAYTVAQAELEAHVARNEFNRMGRRIREKIREIQEIAEVRRIAQTDLYSRRQTLYRILADAQGLREQIEAGGEAGVKSNGLAILLLKASAFAYATGSHAGWEFALDDLGAMHANVTHQRTDVEAFIQALQSQIERVTAAINTPSESRPDNESVLGLTLSGELISQRISKLETDLQALRLAGEAANAERSRLVSKRDLLEDTLASLEGKAAEISIETASADQRFRLGSPAVVNRNTVPVFLLVILSGIIGLIGAIFGAFFLDFMGVRPFLARRKAA